MDEGLLKCKLRKPELLKLKSSHTTASSTSFISNLFSPSIILILILIGFGLLVLVKQTQNNNQSSSRAHESSHAILNGNGNVLLNVNDDEEDERKRKKKNVQHIVSENPKEVSHETSAAEVEQLPVIKQKNVLNLVNLIASEISLKQTQETHLEQKEESNEETSMFETNRYSQYSEISDINYEDTQNQSTMHTEVTIQSPKSEVIRQFSIKHDIFHKDLNEQESILLKEKRVINQTISETEEFMQSQQRYIKNEEIIQDEAQGIRDTSEIATHVEHTLAEQVQIMGTSTNSLLNLFQVKHVNAIADNFKSLDEISNAVKAAGLLRSQLIFGIDFTISNLENGRRTFAGRSLHYVGNEIKNPYQKVIEILGKTLEKFDLDRKIPAYGFGDSMTKDRKVFKFSEKGYCTGFADVLACYNRVLQLIQLSGPTNFAPLIKEAINIVKQTKEYHILVIVADGQVTNARQTRDAIVEASKYPLSIVMVGVGDGPWDTMHEFDDSLPKRQFDNFQFVNYHEVTDGCDNPDEVFALNALMEIPDQYKAIVDLGLLNFN